MKTLHAFKTFGWLVITFIALGMAFLVFGPLVGWHVDVVPTKSMVPAISPGGVVVTRPTSFADATVGQIILFRDSLSRQLICHRVVEIIENDEGRYLKTKGDANNTADSDSVTEANFVGTVSLYIPNVGKIAYLSRLYQTPLVFLGTKISFSTLVILCIGLTLVCLELNNILGWLLEPGQQEYKERLRKRRELILKRKKAFKLG